MIVISQEHLRVLQEGAAQLGVQLSDTAVAQLTLYLEELQRWSPKIDLVSQTDLVEIIHNHFLDSLAVVPLLSEKTNLLDLGSGAGFPGAPIAIALPRVSVSLLEIRRKRVSFLKEVTRKIKAANVKVYEGRAEMLAYNKDLHDTFAVVITRATWDIGTFLQLARPFVQSEGIALAMKGLRLERELRELEIAPQLHGFVLQHRYLYVFPVTGEQREIVMFRSVKNVSRAT